MHYHQLEILEGSTGLVAFFRTDAEIEEITMGIVTA
jgi:hypothetical protein